MLMYISDFLLFFHNMLLILLTRFILFVLGLACIHIATIHNHLNVLKFILNTSKNVNITVSLNVN